MVKNPGGSLIGVRREHGTGDRGQGIGARGFGKEILAISLLKLRGVRPPDEPWVRGNASPISILG